MYKQLRDRRPSRLSRRSAVCFSRPYCLEPKHLALARASRLRERRTVSFDMAPPKAKVAR